MTQQKASTTAVASERKGQARSRALLGPLTVRDVAALVGVLVIFVASLLPLVMGAGYAGNFWNLSPLFFLVIGVVLPLVVGALFVIRRLSPEVKPRVGSLSVDQFASVVAGFATLYFFLATVTEFRAAYVVALIGALVLLAATVLVPWIPVFAADFADRAESPSHPAARDAVPATRRPGAPKPALALPAGPSAGGSASQPEPVQQGRSWNAGSPIAGHTPAGQIFTPAGASAPAATGAAASGSATSGTAGASGAPSRAAAAEETAASATAAAAAPAADFGTSGSATAGTADSSAAAPATAGTGSSTDNAVHDGAQDAVSATSSPTTGEAQGAPAPVQDSGVVPAAESAPATTLNPKVVGSGPAPTESIGATVHPQAQPVAADPFWFAVDRPQNVVDEHTRQFVFKLMPGSWILALEDRGNSFLVQDSHGKTGLLLDLVGVERAPEVQ
ncbi:hypothetical protein [Arthrobacter sp. SDTb3-6]|uniref:hypothetical protein n=1 Tax=Arthrobacter sp. SDTb3-6 TaxID=2713571 RepID=UPI00159D1B6A|nr:hypothetical protein [Arthrobacter sp. SDTb3-6]NVM99745.1 hypothetical protein [Arthrobacter sp. SDTb3-6]